MLAIERSVCGCDYGGCSWTTRAEAEQMARHLALQPGASLLDLGAGSGWPALYIAKATGCDAVLVDLPVAGLRIAAERASDDGIPGNTCVAVATAAALPFTDSSFDAISHSDLLCCLEQKRSVLDACRRVIRRSGRMVFTVISIPLGLSPKRYRLASANGPEFIESDTDYPTLLAQTGWIIKSQQDITTAYGASCLRQLRADEAYEDDLVKLIGTDELAGRLAEWRSKLAAIADGLLRRELFVAEPNPNQADWP
jgi:ubiquinone/menaquinone biosynthesis C-methylase UbiE